VPSVKKARGRYHHGALREAAIAAAASEIDDHGHQGFTLDKVTRRLGVTPAALYRHFANRDALLEAVIWDAFERFGKEMDAAVTSVDEPRAMLVATLRAYVEFALANPGWFRLQFSRVAAKLTGEAQNRNARERLVYPARLRGALRELVGVPADLDRAFLMAWAFAHGVAGLLVEHVLSRLKSDRERVALADELLTAYVAELRPPPRTGGAKTPVRRSPPRRTR
jgi:AcrR family transcriptional regulator